MGTQVSHEPGSPVESPKPPIESASPPTPIPPTPTPADPPTDPRYIQLLEGTIAQQNKRIGELEQARVNTPVKVEAPPLTPDQAREEFFKDPIAANRRLIREELEATIGPIREVAAQFKSTSLVDRLLEQARLNPQFRDHWSPGIESYIREQAAQVPADRLEQNFGFLVVSAIGLKATGVIRDTTPTAPSPSPASPPTPAPMPPTPPYMHPSAPPGPGPVSNAPTYAPLNEDEKRLLREFNAGRPKDKQMTEAGYRQWQSMPSSEVAGSTLGQAVK